MSTFFILSKFCFVGGASNFKFHLPQVPMATFFKVSTYCLVGEGGPIPVVPHKVVAEVSKIGKGWLL